MEKIQKYTANLTNVKNIIPDMIRSVFSSGILDYVQFIPKSKLVIIRISENAESEDRKFLGKYICKTKSYEVSNIMYADKFNTVVEKIFSKFNGICEVHLSYYGD